MSITAKQLSKSGARGKDIDAIVRDQLQLIDDKLLHADRSWGRNVVSYDLPGNLALPGLDKRDAQRIVYSSIIRSLQKRGFEVRLLLENPQTVLYIAWVTELNTDEIDAMNKLIRDSRISRTDLRLFVHGRGAAKNTRAPDAKVPQGAPQSSAPRSSPAPASLPQWAAGDGAVPPPAPRGAASSSVRPATGASTTASVAPAAGVLPV
jgi:hypothetical protein